MGRASRSSRETKRWSMGRPPRHECRGFPLFLVTFPSQFLLGLLIEESQHLKQVAPSLPQGAFRQVIEVRCKALEGGHKQGVELTEIGEAILRVQVVSPPALFDVRRVPPQLALA